jgi:hypothetical protein
MKKFSVKSIKRFFLLKYLRIKRIATKAIKSFFLKMKKNTAEAVKNFFIWISENPMTKTKRFFLLISANPVMTTIGLSVILFVIILAFLAIFGLFVLATPLLYITLFYFGIVTALVIAIRELFKTMITMVELKKGQIALIYFGEKAEIYRLPVLRKPSAIKIIQLPDGWMADTKKYEKRELSVRIKIPLDRYLITSSAIINFLFKFEFLGQFQVADLECVVPKNNELDLPILLTTFVKEVLGVNSRFTEIQKSIEGYSEGRMTMSKLINEILMDLRFPKHLFSNILSTTIRIEEIEFQSEREM